MIRCRIVAFACPVHKGAKWRAYRARCLSLLLYADKLSTAIIDLGAFILPKVSLQWLMSAAASSSVPSASSMAPVTASRHYNPV